MVVYTCAWLLLAQHRHRGKEVDPLLIIRPGRWADAAIFIRKVIVPANSAGLTMLRTLTDLLTHEEANEVMAEFVARQDR